MGEGGGGEEPINLKFTPTWVVALVCSVIVCISLLVERSIHYTGKFLKKKNQKPLYEALLKVKEELMLLGFISLLLVVFQGLIQRICIPESFMDNMLPCSLEDNEDVHHPRPAGHVGTMLGSRRLLSGGGSEAGYCYHKGKVPLLSLEALHQLHIFIFVLAIVHVSFSVSTMILGTIQIHQWKAWEDAIQRDDSPSDPRAVTEVHRLEFIRDHFKGIGNSSFLFRWMVWSQSFKVFVGGQQRLHILLNEPLKEGDKDYDTWLSTNYQIMNWLTNGVEPSIAANLLYKETVKEMWDDLALTYFQQITKSGLVDIYMRIWSISQGDMTILQYYTQISGLYEELVVFQPVCLHQMRCPIPGTVPIWKAQQHSFFKQFYKSVSRSDYTTLRLGFIMTHCKGNRKFSFHRYMMRALEADFKKVVGISWYLWIFVVIFLFLNVSGWHTYFWIAFIPLILLLAVGTKLEHVITKLAHDVAEKHSAIEGELVVNPKDDYFWFHRPRILLYFIHFILFQNAFEIAFFFWIWVMYGFDSCIMGRVVFIVPRLIIGVLVQFLCSYSTLPLYAIVTQMGSTFKKEIFNEHMQQGLLLWAKQARKKGLKPGVKPASAQPEEANGNDIEMQGGEIQRQLPETGGKLTISG